MTISGQRLTHLIEYFDQYAVNEVDETIREESLGALRELQACRALLSAHYDACNSAGCSACIGYAGLYPEEAGGMTQPRTTDPHRQS